MESKLILVFTACVAAVYGASIPEQLAYADSLNTEDGVSGLGIYDGQPTTIEKHPYVAFLTIRNGKLNCTGAIVSDQWIATSGDCVHKLSPTDVKVLIASDDGLTGERYTVTKILIHPKFGFLEYDVGILKVDKKFKWSKKVKPVKLPKTAPKDNTTMIVAAYGDTKAIGGAANGKLLQGKMTWLPYQICKDTCGPYIPIFTERMNCAYNPHKTTLCKNDWAAAFVHSNVLYGFFLAGPGKEFCSQDALPVITSNNVPMAQWIKENTGAKYEGEL